MATDARGNEIHVGDWVTYLTGSMAGDCRFPTEDDVKEIHPARGGGWVLKLGRGAYLMASEVIVDKEPTMPTPTDAAGNHRLTDEQRLVYRGIAVTQSRGRDIHATVLIGQMDAEIEALTAALTATRAEVAEVRHAFMRLPEVPSSPDGDTNCPWCWAARNGNDHEDDCPWALLRDALTPPVPAAVERPQSHSADAKRGLTDRPTVPNDSGQ